MSFSKSARRTLQRWGEETKESETLKAKSHTVKTDLALAQTVKNLDVCSAGDLASIPGLGRFPGEGHGIPLLYSCLGNPTDGYKEEPGRLSIMES